MTEVERASKGGLCTTTRQKTRDEHWLPGGSNHQSRLHTTGGLCTGLLPTNVCERTTTPATEPTRLQESLFSSTGSFNSRDVGRPFARAARQMTPCWGDDQSERSCDRDRGRRGRERIGRPVLWTESDRRRRGDLGQCRAVSGVLVKRLISRVMRGRFGSEVPWV